MPICGADEETLSTHTPHAQAWLGARSTWVQDTPLFRSSSYETGVDLDKVLQQASLPPLLL